MLTSPKWQFPSLLCLKYADSKFNKKMQVTIGSWDFIEGMTLNGRLCSETGSFFLSRKINFLPVKINLHALEIKLPGVEIFPDFITFCCHCMANVRNQQVSYFNWVTLGDADLFFCKFAPCLYVKRPTVLAQLA